ncbi:twin-arginine translocase subunit TatB [Stappia sp. F7233]|uniref:Sec-independent protein translocase protein TatB n=1 Tax=Stappia albiluteola TaxID=2758565 RepID=A0A839AAP3_9HYPH|nr:Sec-independent protein translocase protein TatB [Stappia albiluteola]MBA5776730.1 twin-arginine translocase subunit TatB [Stappia albiluteola]
MFDIGWTELLVIACVAIIVVGPKDLPRMLRTFGQTVGKLRRMAGEFQSTFNEALREAERQADIDDMRREVEKIGNFDPLGDLKKTIQPIEAPQATKPAAEKPANDPVPEAPAKAADNEGGTIGEAPDSGPVDRENEQKAAKGSKA